MGVIRYKEGDSIGNFILKKRLPYVPKSGAIIKCVFICKSCENEFVRAINWISKSKSCGCLKTIADDTYKGFNIKKGKGFLYTGYYVFRKNKRFSKMVFTSTGSAKKAIDTYLRSLSDKEYVTFIEPPPNPKPKNEPFLKEKTVREVSLSEHEQYIAKLLDEK